MLWSISLYMDTTLSFADLYALYRQQRSIRLRSVIVAQHHLLELVLVEDLSYNVCEFLNMSIAPVSSS
jgi:hypothetical protein